MPGVTAAELRARPLAQVGRG
ncbi:hypothetical protein ACTIVE_4932 [Actinomadura verrucosospora]|uniref:Uncharacterized protein n=1 Tax=Actinomadura verrucosospora TaxID=46165 RepID=A0A7D4ARI0_ACTVE|nr:hypothetical protein ACTIVE_4932 [Actinomadura verrucosospora]